MSEQPETQKAEQITDAVRRCYRAIAPYFSRSPEYMAQFLAEAGVRSEKEPNIGVRWATKRIRQVFPEHLLDYKQDDMVRDLAAAGFDLRAERV